MQGYYRRSYEMELPSYSNDKVRRKMSRGTKHALVAGWSCVMLLVLGVSALRRHQRSTPMAGELASKMDIGQWQNRHEGAGDTGAGEQVSKPSYVTEDAGLESHASLSEGSDEGPESHSPSEFHHSADDEVEDDYALDEESHDFENDDYDAWEDEDAHVEDWEDPYALDTDGHMDLDPEAHSHADGWMASQ